MIVLKNNHSS